MKPEANTNCVTARNEYRELMLVSFLTTLLLLSLI